MLLGMRRKWLCAPLFVLLGLPVMSRAGSSQVPQQNPDQRPLSSLSLEELASLDVTAATKEPEEIWKTPAAIYVITNEEIRRSGVTNVSDALRLAPGVEVGRISSTTWAVGVRGLQGNFSKSVLVLIDGRNVYTPLFAGVFWDVQDLTLEDINRIEVIRGPGAALWGANAVNGVINITTKKAKDTQGLLVSGIEGNEEGPIASFRYGGKAGEHGFYRVYGKYLHRDDSVLPDGT